MNTVYKSYLSNSLFVFALVVGGELLPGGCQSLAVTAPWCIELDEHGLGLEGSIPVLRGEDDESIGSNILNLGFLLLQ